MSNPVFIKKYRMFWRDKSGTFNEKYFDSNDAMANYIGTHLFSIAATVRRTVWNGSAYECFCVLYGHVVLESTLKKHINAFNA